MKILIVGGWKKADFLTKSLLEKKHQVVIIHDDHSYCQFLARTYGVPVVCGDGSEPYILEEADINGYDVVIALTPKDEDNLVICQLAKKQFNIKKSFAIVGNPKNVQIFKKLGIDTVISSAYVASNIIEQMATVEEISNYIPLDNGQVGLMEIFIKENSSICNKIISNIDFPKEAIIACIIRGFNTVIPKGDTKILPQDKLIILSSPEIQNKIIKFISERSEK